MFRVFLALTLLFGIAPVMAVEQQSEPAIVAFIGKLISIKELPDACPDTNASTKKANEPQSLCIQMDSLYEARYEVTEILNGSLSSKEIVFNIADHYGFPNFAEYQYALLFVDVSSKDLWLEKYQGYAVHRTSDNYWASCGNPIHGDQLENAAKKIRAISFSNDFGIVGQFSREGISNRFFDNKHLIVDGGKIICRSGIYASDLYNFVRTGVLAARGIQLPALNDQ